MVSILRKIYRQYIYWPRLDKFIYAILDFLTDIYSYLRGYSFPKNWIRRWKLDMLHGLYEKETYLLFQKIVKPNMVVVDIGAHIGYFTKLFSELVGKNGIVYAFEADPDNFQILQKNSKKLKNVKIYPLAITDRAGVIDFYHCEEKSGCHSVLPNVPLNFKTKKITVPALDLETMLLKEKVTKIDLIKMDIEGGESAAINGMENILRQNNDLSLVVEFAPDWITASGNNPLNFLKKLASFGFTIFAIMPRTHLKNSFGRDTSQFWAAQEVTTKVYPPDTPRRSDAVIARNWLYPFGLRRFFRSASLLFGKVATATISSSRLAETKKSLATRLETIFEMGSYQLIKLNPNDSKSYEKFLEKSPNATDSCKNCINLYCAKKQISHP